MEDVGRVIFVDPLCSWIPIINMLEEVEAQLRQFPPLRTSLAPPTPRNNCFITLCL